MMKTVLIVLIRFYRKYVSPLKPPCCRFTPTCSTFRVLLSCHAMNFAEFLHFCLILLLKFRKQEHLGG